MAINRTSATTDANTVLYDVEIVHANPAAEDVAKQILAVISTLVVAVAGFYFGSRSVQAATNSVRRSTESSPSAPKITAISPSPANTAEQIFIFGDNFGEPATGSTIMIRDMAGAFVAAIDSDAEDIEEWVDNRIRLQLPMKMVSGNRYVIRVIVGSRVSASRELEVKPGATSSIEKSPAVANSNRAQTDSPTQ